MASLLVDEKTAQEKLDEEEEERYNPSAPMQSFDFPLFLQYKDHILSDCFHHYYITEDWNPEFFRCLVYEGFISVSHKKYLIPEIQVFYGVLTFNNLHIGKKCMKIIRKYTIPRPPTPLASPTCSNSHYRLRLYANKHSDMCISRIQECRFENWLTDQYVECMRASGLHVHTFELYLECVENPDVAKGTVAGSDDEVYISRSLTLIAGEIGYTVGSVYTSLTGFCEKEPTRKRKDFLVDTNGPSRELPISSFLYTPPIGSIDTCPVSSSNDGLTDSGDGGGGSSAGNGAIVDIGNCSTADSKDPRETYSPFVNIPKDIAGCCGTIQLACLGKWLDSYGYSFWNLGHPPRREIMKYKRDLGGVVLPRSDFLCIWRDARDMTPEGGDVFSPNEFDFNIVLGRN